MLPGLTVRDQIRIARQAGHANRAGDAIVHSCQPPARVLPMLMPVAPIRLASTSGLLHR